MPYHATPASHSMHCLIFKMADVAYYYSCCGIVCLSVYVFVSLFLPEALVSRAKTSKLIDMRFWLWIGVGPRNHV